MHHFYTTFLNCYKVIHVAEAAFIKDFFKISPGRVKNVKKRFKRNKIKQIHNLNVGVLRLNPIVGIPFGMNGIQFQHSSIQIVDLFDFVPLKSFFHVFDPPGGDFEKIIDKCCFCYMYYFVAIEEGCIKVMHIWKMVKNIFILKNSNFLMKICFFSLLVRISCRNFIINKKSLFFQLKERWDHTSILITTILSWFNSYYI